MDLITINLRSLMLMVMLLILGMVLVYVGLSRKKRLLAWLGALLLTFILPLMTLLAVSWYSMR